MQKPQHPAEITCPFCKTTLRRTGSIIPDGRVYSCFCGGTTRVVPIKRKVPSGRNNQPPNNAA